MLFLLLLILSAPLVGQFDDIAAKAAQARDADDLDKAVALYRQAVHLRPNWAEGWWYLGTLAYDRKQFPDAVASLRKVVALAPKDGKAFAMLGLSESQLNQGRSALRHLTEALSLGVGDEANMRQVVLFTEGNLLISEGDFGHAQDSPDRLARELATPDDDLLLALGRAVIGIQPSKSPVTPDTRDLILTAGHAEYLDANRKNSEALEAYAELAKRFPQTHDVQFAYGRFLLKNHADNEAVAAFKREIENTPQHLLARLGIAGALLSSDPSAGLPYAEQAVKLAPKLSEGHFLLGASLLATDQTARAITELETARHLSPNDPRVYFRLAKAYALVHRIADAAQARQKFQQIKSATH